MLGCGGTDGPPPVVTDPAETLTAQQRGAIAAQHEVLLRDHDVDYRVDVVQDAGDLLVHGVRRFADLEVGSRGRSGRGLLLVIDPVQDRLRLEVGQGLEGVYTDAFVAYLEQRQMVPFFRAGRLADGVLAATELVVTRAQQAEDAAGFQPGVARGSAGGGAETRAHLGAGPDESFREGPQLAAGSAPEQTVERYLEAMAQRNGRADLELYSEETRGMLRDLVLTPGQMDAVARAYRECRAEPVRSDHGGSRAVLRYPVEERHCAPWLLVREQGRWRLDLMTVRRVVRFGAGNQWHFTAGEPHPYEFA
jgi:uncharacterized protein